MKPSKLKLLQTKVRRLQTPAVKIKVGAPQLKFQFNLTVNLSRKSPAPKPAVKKVLPKVIGISCWQILQIERTKDKAIIEKAYKARAMKLHPDRGGTVDQFVLLQKAYQKALQAANS